MAQRRSKYHNLIELCYQLCYEWMAMKDITVIPRIREELAMIDKERMYKTIVAAAEEAFKKGGN